MIRTIALLTALIANPVFAEISVRSGEHGSFTRLVFNLPSDMEWSSNQNGTAATVRVSDSSQSFEFSSVFDRIPKTRLAELSSESAGELTLGLACDCLIETFQYDRRTWVLDIREANGTLLPTGAILENEEEANALKPIDEEVISPPAIRLPVIPDEIPEAAMPPLGYSNVTNHSEASAVSEPIDVEQFSSARQVLLTEISRAAGQGLIEPQLREIPSQINAPNEETAQDVKPKEIPEPVVPNVNLRAENSMDSALAAIFSRDFSSPGVSACISSRQINVSKWNPDNGFQQDVGVYRRQLFSELGRVKGDIAESLAKLYVHYGFGAEAIEILNMLEEPERKKTPVRTLAEIMEYGQAQTPSAFANQFSCESSAALWAVLSVSELPKNTDLNAASVVRAFDALPLHLRKFLGPKLSERLRLAGDEGTARDVMRIVERGSRKINVETNMELSQLDKSAGDTESAEERLEEVVEADAPPSPEALIQLIDDRVAAGKPVDPGMATLAAAYSFEFEGSELGLDLKRAYVLALADSGQYLDAIGALGTLSAEFSADQRRGAKSLVFDILTKNAPDEIFLEGTIPYLIGENLDLSPSVQNALSLRLLDLGVTTHVADLLRQGGDGEVGRQRRLLRAELSILEGRPKSALSQLLGLVGDEADELRIEAHEALGDFERADQISLQSASQEIAQEAAFLSGEWSDLTDSNLEAVSEFAATRLTPRADQPSAPSLEVSQNLLQESSETQARIGALLSEFQVTTVLPETE